MSIDKATPADMLSVQLDDQRAVSRALADAAARGARRRPSAERAPRRRRIQTAGRDFVEWACRPGFSGLSAGAHVPQRAVSRRGLRRRLTASCKHLDPRLRFRPRHSSGRSALAAGVRRNRCTCSIRSSRRGTRTAGGGRPAPSTELTANNAALSAHDVGDVQPRNRRASARESSIP